jgi:cell filamentation protein
MPTPAESWAGYFFPDTVDSGTGQGTLRNHFIEREARVLSGIEFGAVTFRQFQLMCDDVAVPRTFDAEHVRAIHRHLFQDVYDWAGEYRTVNLFKGTPRGFADVTGGEIDRYLADVNRLVTATAWGRLRRDEFVERTATVFAYLNQAHPFREGNGRTAKVFMDQVSELSGYSLDYDRVSPAEWNDASKWSGPDLLAYEPHAEELVPVFEALAVERVR